MGLSQSFFTQKKYTLTHPQKNAVILKGNMGITHMVSPVYNNLAVFFFFGLLLSMTLWYPLICGAQTESENVKCESISYRQQIYSWLINYLSRLQIVNERFVNIQRVQVVCTQASQVSHKVMQSWAEYTQLSTEHKWHISICHHNVNSSEFISYHPW